MVPPGNTCLVFPLGCGCSAVENEQGVWSLGYSLPSCQRDLLCSYHIHTPLHPVPYFLSAIPTPPSPCGEFTTLSLVSSQACFPFLGSAKPVQTPPSIFLFLKCLSCNNSLLPCCLCGSVPFSLLHCHFKWVCLFSVFFFFPSFFLSGRVRRYTQEINLSCLLRCPQGI